MAAVKVLIEASLDKNRCTVRMAPERGFSKYWPDWISGGGSNWPAALRDLAEKIDGRKPTYRRGRRPHDVKAAGRLRQRV